MKEKETREKQNGITLIALVVTIVVLLILAGTSIAMLAGDSGIITNSKEAKTKNAHAEVYEGLQIEVQNYMVEKEAIGLNEHLMEYLQRKGFVNDDYTVNIYNLLGKTIAYGNGTGTKDVYKLEESDKLSKVASIENVKLSSERITEEYILVYYDKKENMEEIGYITSISDSTTEIDWEAAKENAKKHPSQSPENGDIGIGTDGNSVNLDLWRYRKILMFDGTVKGFALNEVSGCSASPGYDNSNIVEGKIQGKVPQYIKVDGEDEWYEVINMSSTFLNCEDLVIAPEIPSTVTSMTSTFNGCVSLTTAPTIPMLVDDLRMCFCECYCLTGELIINSSDCIYYYDCLQNASTNPDANLVLKGTCPKLREIYETRSEDSNITLEE